MILDLMVSVSHLTKDSDNANKEQFVLDTGLWSIPINIQSAGAEETAISEGVFGRTYTAFTTQSGIHIGDLLTVSGTGQLLRVKGMEDWTSPDLVPHYEYILVEPEENEVL